MTKKGCALAVVVVAGLLTCAAMLALRLGLFAPSLQRLAGTEIEPTPLSDLAGHPHTFGELRGQPATLYFWATWCGPCVGHLARWAREGVPDPPGTHRRFVAVALNEDRAEVTALLRRIGYRQQAWVATDGMRLLQRRYAGNDRRAVPYLVDIDAQERIVSARYGEY